MFNYRKKFQKISYSQSGEDLIADHIFNVLSKKTPTYIDIGANHPFALNNTAFFYQNGSVGINIEPDISLISPFSKYRKKDLNLNLGIHSNSGELELFCFKENTMNTFSEEIALELVEKYGFQLIEKRIVPVKTFNQILRDYCNDQCPDLLCIDAEGVDEIIINSIDFSNPKNRPTVIIIETISYSESGNGIKNTKLIDLITDFGYIYYADTYINSIFVASDKWKR